MRELRQRVRPNRAAPFLHRKAGVRELRQRVRPFRAGSFSLNLSGGIRRLRTAGTCRAPRRGQKGRTTCGFPSSLNSCLSLGGSGADVLYVTAAKWGYGRGFFLPYLSQPVRSVRFLTATHTGCSAQAQHKVNCPKGKRRSPGVRPRHTVSNDCCTLFRRGAHCAPTQR